MDYYDAQISWSNIDFVDNADCLELIEARKPPGILALLDETCLMPVRAP
jgi:myosin heavy subunit